MRETAKRKVSHFIATALIFQGSDRLVGERTRIVNRMKATLARLGVRNFKPTLRKATQRLATVHTPEGMPLPPNVLAELQRDMARLGFVVSQIREIEDTRQKRLEQEPETGHHAMVRQVARVIGIGIETADMLVNEVLSRPMRDRKAVARYPGLTGSPDESGARPREQGLAKAGNARGRRGMIQLAWRFLRFQKQSALAPLCLQHHHRIDVRHRPPLPLQDARPTWPARPRRSDPAGSRRLATAHARAPRRTRYVHSTR